MHVYGPRLNYGILRNYEAYDVTVGMYSEIDGYMKIYMCIFTFVQGR